MDVVPPCTCSPHQTRSDPCHVCGDGGGGNDDGDPFLPGTVACEGSRVLDSVPRWIGGAISGALTGLFALGKILSFSNPLPFQKTKKK